MIPVVLLAFTTAAAVAQPAATQVRATTTLLQFFVHNALGAMVL